MTSCKLSALVSAHATWLSAFLRGLTQCDADAEDCFQEVWLRVSRSGGPRSGSERAYLARVARSVVIDRFRRNGRVELTLDAAEGAELEDLSDSAPTPDVVHERAATHEEVLAAVRALPSGPQTVALMRIEGELTFQEIADALGVPLGTALTWMRAATTRLRKMLEEKP